VSIDLTFSGPEASFDAAAQASLKDGILATLDPLLGITAADVVLSIQSTTRRQLQSGFTVTATIITTSAAEVSSTFETMTTASIASAISLPTDLAITAIAAPIVGVTAVYPPPLTPPLPPPSPLPPLLPNQEMVDGVVIAAQAAASSDSGATIGIAAGLAAVGILFFIVAFVVVRRRMKRTSTVVKAVAVESRSSTGDVGATSSAAGTALEMGAMDESKI